MTYIESVEILDEIESKYDVMSITYKQVAVWPFLRIYLLHALQKSQGHRSMSLFNILLVCKGLFAYNPFRFFRRYDIWLFNACERRKKMGGKFIHRVSGYMPFLNFKTLTIELNGNKPVHYSMKNIEEKSIVSESWFLFMAHFIEHLLRIVHLKIERQEVIDKILKDYEVKFDYKYFIRYLVAQKNVIGIILSITCKPQKVVIECPYNKMGYVWAFKNHGISVVELQHGVLNHLHYAYNSHYSSVELYPDEICVYGDEEFDYFENYRRNYCEKVYKTGLYILEKADRFFVKDIFQKYRNNYKTIIVVAGQALVENQLVDFIKCVAGKNPDLMFFYIPRYPLECNPLGLDNVNYLRDVNIYEYLKWSDIHCTVSSTTCLEAQFFRKPTIFYNYDNLSIKYYGDVLGFSNGAVYIECANEFTAAYQKILSNSFVYKDVFTPNCMEKYEKLFKNTL